MSQENVELAYRLADAWNRDDWEFMEACYTPDVVGIAPEGWPEAEDAHGWPALRRQFEWLKDPWETERMEVDDVHMAGAKLLVQARWIASGRASGMAVETPITFLWALDEERRISRVDFFLAYADALEAAGLSE